MAKVDMTKFRKNREEKAKTEPPQEVAAPTERSQEKNIASPSLNRSFKSGMKKIERKSLRLPVSGKEIELTVMEVVPSDCVIHPRNRRIQSLLKLENPKVASLKDSMAREKQREPILARIVEKDGRRAIEVLDGSRRRFVAEQLHLEDPDFRLRAWVGSISDADADYLAKEGNAERDDVSPWEEAQYIRSISLENPNWSQEVIAANEGISQSSVNNLLAISEIPIELVQLLESPDLLTVSSGLKLIKLTKDEPLNQYMDRLKEGAPYNQFSVLVSTLKTLIEAERPQKKPSANKKIEIKSGKNVRAEIGKNRKVKGQYKIDLYDISDDEYDQLYKVLEKILAK